MGGANLDVEDKIHSGCHLEAGSAVLSVSSRQSLATTAVKRISRKVLRIHIQRKLLCGHIKPGNYVKPDLR